jgi:hypothetical protein
MGKIIFGGKSLMQNMILKNQTFFCCRDSNASRFFQGFMWALRSVRFGYRWMVGDGTKVRLWEDTWFGTSPLSVQFGDIYIICNEQMATLN